MTYDEIDELIKRDYPFTVIGHFPLPQSDYHELFGKSSTVDVVMRRDLSAYRYNSRYRWVYWVYPRFKTDADAVLFKLRYG